MSKTFLLKRKHKGREGKKENIIAQSQSNCILLNILFDYFSYEQIKNKIRRKRNFLKPYSLCEKTVNRITSSPFIRGHRTKGLTHLLLGRQGKHVWLIVRHLSIKAGWWDAPFMLQHLAKSICKKMMLVNRRYFKNNDFMSRSCFYLQSWLYVIPYVQKYANVSKTLHRTQFVAKHLCKTWCKALCRKICKCECSFKEAQSFSIWKSLLVLQKLLYQNCGLCFLHFFLFLLCINLSSSVAN